MQRVLLALALAGCSEAIDTTDYASFDPRSYESDDEFVDTGVAWAPEDMDQDGYVAEDDCDDQDARVYPGADELCDGVDNDCDGRVDDEDPILDGGDLYFPDADGDGWGDELQRSIKACVMPEGYAPGGDCDDDDPRFHPQAVEDDCTDPSDYNCDGSVGYDDSDSDGWAACLDCDDANSTIRPDADEICDGLDNDCNGAIDQGAIDAQTFYRDGDGDGYGDGSFAFSACEVPGGFSATDGDCDDDSDTTYPGAPEACDGIDSDCGGVSWLEQDADGDGLLACDVAMWVRTDDQGSTLTTAMEESAALLEDRGITLESASLSDEPFDPTTLADVGLIVLYGTHSDGPLTTQDQGLLESWVNGGGSVLLQGSDPSESSCSFMDGLPSAWGLSCKNQMGFSTLAPSIVAHDVTNGVVLASVQDAERWNVSSPSTAVVYDGTDAVVTVAEVGGGKVAGVSDNWMFYPAGTDAAFDISAGDNELLVDNLWAWLLDQGM